MTGYEAGKGKVKGHIGPEDFQAPSVSGLAGPLDFIVGEQGIQGDLYRAAVTAKMSKDLVTVTCGGKDYPLKGSLVVKTMMDMESQVRRVYEEGASQVHVQVRANGATAEKTLTTVCNHLFPDYVAPAEISEAVKKDA